MRSFNPEISDLESRIAQVEGIVDAQADPEWQTMSLGMLSKLSDPIHQMVLSWEDWYMANNGLGGPEKWDPENNPTHMIRSEISDVYKAMSKIRMLE